METIEMRAQIKRWIKTASARARQVATTDEDEPMAKLADSLDRLHKKHFGQ